MFKKIFNTEFHTITGAAVVIGLSTLLSRLVGIVRDRLFAHYFGAGLVMDAYYASFKIPDFVYSLLIAGALSSAFIPTFTKLFYNRENKSAAWRLANNIITIIAVTLFVVAGLGIIFAPSMTHLLFGGFPAKTGQLTAKFMRIMFISPFLLGISMVFGGVLQSLKQFFTYSLAPVFYNLGIIFGIIVFVPLLGPVGIAWGVVLGAFLHLTIQTTGAYASGFRWRWTFDLADPESRLVGKLMIPRTIGLAITQINTIIFTILATLLTVGSVAVYNFANNLQAVPTGLVAIPFALAVFPVLSSFELPTDRAAFVKKVGETARQILFLMVPAMVLLILLRAQIVRVILGSGAFSWSATIATADALAMFSLGLIGQALVPLLARAFYALSNTKTPFLIGIIAEAISIIFALLLMHRFGVTGLALAGSIGITTNALLLVYALRLRLGRLGGRSHFIFTLKIIGAALGMGLAVQGLKYPLNSIFDLNHLGGIFLQGFIAGLIGIVIYGLLCHFLKVAEMTEFLQSFRKRWLKFWNIKEGIDEAEQL